MGGPFKISGKCWLCLIIHWTELSFYEGIVENSQTENVLK